MLMFIDCKLAKSQISDVIHAYKSKGRCLLLVDRRYFAGTHEGEQNITLAMTKKDAAAFERESKSLGHAFIDLSYKDLCRMKECQLTKSWEWLEDVAANYDKKTKIAG